MPLPGPCDLSAAQQGMLLLSEPKTEGTVRAASVVLAAVLVAGMAGAATVEFAGLRWDVRTGGGGPFGTGLWDDRPDSVCVDGSGALHLRLHNVGGRWYQAEVEARSIGRRGEYRFFVHAGPSVDPLLSPRLEEWELEAHNVVLGLFTLRQPRQRRGERLPVGSG